MTIRFYGPVSVGTFFDIVRELGQSGMSCNQASPNLARCTWRGARFTIVRDDDEMRAQLLEDGGLGAHAWDVVDPILTRASATRVGQSMVEGAAERVGGFYYDPDLAKFGNAFSPFVQSDSFERANLAMQRPFQDRYNPRYDNQPTWADWMGMGGYAVGVDMACQPPPTPEEEREILRTGGQLGFQKSCEECGNCDSPGWAAYRSRISTRGSFEVVDKRALLTTGVIAGITTLVALNNKKHWLEIAAVGTLGVALVWGKSAGTKQARNNFRPGE